MLPANIYKHLFGTSSPHTLSDQNLKKVRGTFEKFNINTSSSSVLPEVNLHLPPIEGANLEDHFQKIAQDQIAPYVKKITSLLGSIPPVPENWLLQEGWTRYSPGKIEQVDHPLEDALFFDVEVCMKEGPLPTMATAVSSEAWYGWVSKSLVEGSLIVKHGSYTPTDLVPMESKPEETGKKLSKNHKKPKILVGHNVSYDRVRIKEQYWLNQTGMRFLDTMSMHVCVSGVNSYQRNILKSSKPSEHEDWKNNASLNSLAEVYKLYCGEEPLDKKMRDEFVEGDLVSIKSKFQDLMMYCAGDNVATHKIFQKLYPMFLERFQHPVTLAGMLELGTAYLPVNSNWLRYLEESQSTFEDLSYEAKFMLAKRADEVCKLQNEDKYKKDLWMWNEDWSTKEIKLKTSVTKATRDEIQRKKEERERERHEKREEEKKYLFDENEISTEEDQLEEKFDYLMDTTMLPKRPPFMPGYPEWYRKLCPKEKSEDWLWFGPENISTSTQITPKLLNLTWEKYPLHHIKEHGWGFLVPHTDDPNIETDLPIRELLKYCPVETDNRDNVKLGYTMGNFQKDVQNHLPKQEFWRFKKEINPTSYKGSGIWCNVDIDDCCWFFKLPHKDGSSSNVGNPLARDFLNKLSDHVLAGLDASANKGFNISLTIKMV